MKKLVITHGNCVDGCSCRAILEEKYGNEAEYIEVDHAEIDPAFPEKFQKFWDYVSQFKNTEVFMADICLKEIFINLFLDNKNTVNIIDHHETALPLIQKLRDKKSEDPSMPLNITFSDNNTESGAMLTWKHVHPNVNPPRHIEFVSDGDLWTFKYGEQTNYYYSGLLANNRQPKEIPKDYWVQLLHDNKEVQKMVDLGSTIYGPYIEEVKSFLPYATEVVLDGHTGYMVNASMKYKSELGNFLAQKNMTFGLVWEEKEDGMVACSLRSIKPFRVKEIAEKFGGGGHGQAAAFRVESREKLEEILVKELQTKKPSFKNKLKNIDTKEEIVEPKKLKV